MHHAMCFDADGAPDVM